MVHVPGGRIGIGCRDDREKCRPAQEVRVAAFFLDRTEVTGRAYQACVAKGACSRPQLPELPAPGRYSIRGATPPWVGAADERPVTGVLHDQAAAYCRSVGKRLPSPEEWEAAARGTDGRLYPWGDEPPTCERARFSGCEGAGPDRVGGRRGGASPSGALDMAGNVAEIVDAFAGDRGAEGPAPGVELRGGSFEDGPEALLSHRTRSSRFASAAVGFRCAKGLY